MDSDDPSQNNTNRIDYNDWQMQDDKCDSCNKIFVRGRLFSTGGRLCVDRVIVRAVVRSCGEACFRVSVITAIKMAGEG
jgi:hypothetical protein